MYAWVDAKRKTELPKIYTAQTDFNTSVLKRCPTLNSPYRPTPFLSNGHVETIFAARSRTAPHINYRRECLRMPDGGTVALDWEHFDVHEQGLPDSAPVLILFPGLTGGSNDSYVLHAVQQARKCGIRAVVFNSRGTGDSPVTTPQYYSASFTGDTRHVVAHVSKRYPHSTLLAAGWSLGANILVRYLGEQRHDTPIAAAVSMCNPFDLLLGNTNFETGFNRIYDANLAASLGRIFRRSAALWRGMGPPFNPTLAANARTIREFDEAITIHSFGWSNVDQYYIESSSARSIPDVRVPLLCIQALDDPIAPKEAIPYDACAANPNVTLVTTPCGGHLGWVSGRGGLRGQPWSDDAMTEWFSSVVQELRARGITGRLHSPGAAPAHDVITLAAGNGNGNGAPPAARDAVPAATAATDSA